MVKRLEICKKCGVKIKNEEHLVGCEVYRENVINFIKENYVFFPMLIMDTRNIFNHNYVLGNNSYERMKDDLKLTETKIFCNPDTQKIEILEKFGVEVYLQKRSENSRQ